MRHRKHHHQLGVKKEHRIALMANMASALIEHGRIHTTLAKAKALRPFVEKTITLAKRAQKASPDRALYLRRLAISRVRNKTVVHKLFEERVEEFANRDGGYTRVYKIGRRLGDAAEMAIIELIDAEDEGYRSSRRKSKKTGTKAGRESKDSEPEASESSSQERTPDGEESGVAESAEDEVRESESDVVAAEDDEEDKEKSVSG